MTLRDAAKSLLVLSLALPVVQGVLYWVAGLLRSMGDTAGAAIVGHVNTACQVVWSISLVGLLLIVSLTIILSPQEPGE